MIALFILLIVFLAWFWVDLFIMLGKVQNDTTTEEDYYSEDKINNNEQN